MIKKSLLLILMLATALSFASVARGINIPVEDNIKKGIWLGGDSGDYCYIYTAVTMPATTSSITFYTNDEAGSYWGPSVRSWLTESGVVKHSYIEVNSNQYTFNELSIKDFYATPSLFPDMTTPEEFTINLHDLNGVSEYGATSIIIRIYLKIDFALLGAGLLTDLNSEYGPYFELNYNTIRVVYTHKGVIIAERYIVDDTDAGYLPITYPQPTHTDPDYTLAGWRTKTGDMYNHEAIHDDWYTIDEDDPNTKTLYLYAYFSMDYESGYIEPTPVNNLPTALATLLDAIGMDNSTGYIIIFIALVLLVTIALTTAKISAVPILTIDIVLYGLFIYFDILPTYAIILFGTLYVAGFLLVVNRRVQNE